MDQYLRAMKQLFVNIKELLQVNREGVRFLSGEEMKTLPLIKNAYLLIEGDRIKDYGSMEQCPEISEATRIDLTGRVVLPTWCDSHTHLVYAGNRIGEFVDRLNGLSYKEIAQRGGGILNSAKKLQTVPQEDLYRESAERLEQLVKMGTGAVEIKSGYGLTVESELKMLRVIQQLKKNYTLPIKATFLGAHALPQSYDNNKKGYLKRLVEELLPVIQEESLAEYIDIFCEKDYFSVADMKYLLEAAKAFQLIPKVHVNQFSTLGGVAEAVRLKALSVDHLEQLDDADITALRGSATMPVALPGCSFYLGIPYTPARRIIDAGLPLALATDYNPGSAPSGNMNFVVATACIKMKMTPEEAINAATLNGAYAMGLESEVGSITRGKRANFIITKPITSYQNILYSFGESLVERVFINGVSPV